MMGKMLIQDADMAKDMKATKATFIKIQALII